jgi:hypothetical protein
MSSNRLVFGLAFFAVIACFSLGWVVNATFRPAVLLVVPVSASDVTVAAARAQLELQNRNDDRLVSVVSSTIGVVLTITIGLAAFGWYNSNLAFDRELASLKKELERFIEAAANASKAEVTAQMGALEKQQLQKAAQTAGQAAQKALHPIEDRLAELEDVIYEAEADKLSAEAAAHSRSGVQGQAFSKFVKALKLLAQTRYGFTNYAESIDGLQSLATGGYRPDADQLGDFEACVKALDKSIDAPSLRPALQRLVATVRS